MTKPTVSRLLAVLFVMVVAASAVVSAAFLVSHLGSWDHLQFWAALFGIGILVSAALVCGVLALIFLGG